MSNTIMASPTDAQTIRFCERIAPKAKPIVLEIKPEAGSRSVECFYNVRDKVEREGGSIKFGWVIWTWPDVYIEAEHHAVYEPPSGSPWLDITPAPDGDTQRLFLPDDTVPFDFDEPLPRRDNIRHPLTNDPLVHDHLRLAARFTRFLNHYRIKPGEAQVPLYLIQEAQMLQQKRREVILLMQQKYTKRNARCYCGSGKKFKNCHGRV